jgi:hypothetical protein
VAPKNLPGRQTGSEEWRAQRGELGHNNNNNTKNLHQAPAPLEKPKSPVHVFAAGTPSKAHQKIVDFLTHHNDTQDADFDRFDHIFLVLVNKNKRFAQDDCDFMYKCIDTFPVEKVFPFLDVMKFASLQLDSKVNVSPLVAKLIGFVTVSSVDKIACINRFLSLQVLCNLVARNFVVNDIEKVFVVGGELLADKRAKEAMGMLVKNVENGKFVEAGKLEEIKKRLI